jgi:hypothetical protein
MFVDWRTASPSEIKFAVLRSDQEISREESKFDCSHLPFLLVLYLSVAIMYFVFEYNVSKAGIIFEE